MKTTNSPNGHFGIHFFFAAALAVASLTGCSAAVGEPSADSTAELDEKPTETRNEKAATVEDLANVDDELGNAPSPYGGGGATAANQTPPARIHRIQ